MTTTIWDKNKLHVGASIKENGDLEIAGQDLNGRAGEDEYEYWITVKAGDIPKVVAALPGPDDADVIERLRRNAEMLIQVGERTFLTLIGVETGFHSWF